jgi:hypothetical protein
MKKILLLLVLSFFSTQSFAGSCPDGSEPVKSISADGTYFVYNCSGTQKDNTTSNSSSNDSSSGIDTYGGGNPPEEAILNSIPKVMNLEDDFKSISRGEIILDSLKSWNKKLRGKKPIYITSGGSQISVDPIGDEKAIKLFKRF